MVVLLLQSLGETPRSDRSGQPGDDEAGNACLNNKLSQHVSGCSSGHRASHLAWHLYITVRCHPVLQTP